MKDSAAGMDRRTFVRKATALAGGAAAATFLATADSGRLCAQSSDAGQPSTTWVSTTRTEPWRVRPVRPLGYLWNMLDVEILFTTPAQTIQGFGACFNELGWTSLQALSPVDQGAIFHELFSPGAGANFTLCRLPLGANDFSRGWYSYDETPGDFSLKQFSIANDLDTLIPFVKSAKRCNPALRLWSSPWSPPVWMKRNGSYAEVLQVPGRPPNGLHPDQVGKEGWDMFILQEKYLDAYARYFGKYIDAYKSHDIDIGIVMPQNEFNSTQPFPSCTWTAEGLTRFIQHLGPVMAERQVQIFFGTLERGNIRLLESAMNDPAVGKYIDGVGLQWAGKNALTAIHKKYPNLPIYQSEQECGDGKNDWEYCGYCWSLMKDYFSNGASGYEYWNISLKTGGLSHWGWPQNSLITVDTANKSYRFNHEYYLMKHVSHFVQPGAKRLQTQGTFENLLAFLNPDKSVAVVAMNETPYERPLAITVSNRQIAIMMDGQSFNTILI